VDGVAVDVSVEELEELITLDLVIPKTSEDYMFFCGKEQVELQFEDILVPLKLEPSDVFFQLRGIEAMDIVDEKALNHAQHSLANINIFKVPKLLRQNAVDMKALIQDQVDKYHQIFADISRGKISSNHVTSTLQSMRYDFKFNKARRMRCLNQRAMRNASIFAEIDKKLEELTISQEAIESFEALSKDQYIPL